MLDNDKPKHLHNVKNNTSAPQVYRLAIALALEHLWCHIARRAARGGHLHVRIRS